MKLGMMVLGDMDIPHLVETSGPGFPITVNALLMLLHNVTPGQNTVILGPIVEVTYYDLREGLEVSTRLLSTLQSYDGFDGSIFEASGVWLRGDHK